MSLVDPPSASVARFGAFELDLRSGELRRNGATINLHGQPIEILGLLLEKPGALVTREELRQKLWSEDTFVDFEHGLNAAVKRLRAALGDEADAPRYIETVPRRGYRFIGRLDGGVASADRDPLAVVREPPRGTTTRKRARLVAIAATTVLSALFALAWTLMRSQKSGEPPTPSLVRLTFDDGVQMQPTWSPDGRFIAYSSDRGGDFDIWVQPVTGGDAVQVTKDPAHDWQPDWSPKGDLIAFRSERHGGGIFLVPTLGGEERRVTNFGYRPRWSPDGTRLLFAGWVPPGLGASFGNIATRFFAVALDGTAPREILRDLITQMQGRATVAWHPDGRVSVLGQPMDSSRGVWTFSTASVDGAGQIDSAIPPTVRASMKTAGLESWGEDLDLAWSPTADAIYFVAVSNHIRNVWKVDVDPKTLRWTGGPYRLTAGPGPESDLVVSSDGAKATFTTAVHTRRVWSFPLDRASGRIVGSGKPLTSSDASVSNAELSLDDRTLLFEVERAGALGHRHEVWEKRLDDGRERLVRSNHMNQPGQFAPSTPRVSPNGRLFTYSRPGRSFYIQVEDLSSAEQWSLTEPEQHGYEAPWGWSPDGQWIVATGNKYTPGAWGLYLIPASRGYRTNREIRMVTSSKVERLYQAGIAPDGQWIAFLAVDRDLRTTIVAVRAGGGSWTRLTDGRFRDDKPRWSSDGRYIYFVSPRDGPLDVWAMPFDSMSGHAGEPFKVTNFDNPRVMIFPTMSAMEMAVSTRRLVLPLLEVSSSIWMLENIDR